MNGLQTCFFRTPKSYVSTTQKRSEVKKFVMYSLYGWGIPASLTLIAFLAYEIFDTPYVVRPFMGAFHCFWERRSGNYGMFLFYSMPLIFMEIANLVFFVKTIVYCLKIKSEINRMNDNRISVKGRKKYYNLDKEQLILILKLSVTMGISFVFEVVSSLVDFSANSQTEYVEIIWDTINCLQGVYVFLIFVCKAKVLSLCKNKITWSRDRKISVSSIPTTSTQISIPLSSKNKLRDV
jgi:G protein-coupled receptor Mth (Methuselah protein)